MTDAFWLRPDWEAAKDQPFWMVPPTRKRDVIDVRRPEPVMMPMILPEDMVDQATIDDLMNVKPGSIVRLRGAPSNSFRFCNSYEVPNKLETVCS